MFGSDVLDVGVGMCLLFLMMRLIATRCAKPSKAI
jgi:hypothetical protein